MSLLTPETIRIIAQNLTSDYWIGLRKNFSSTSNQTLSWSRWANGDPLTFQNWYPGWPVFKSPTPKKYCCSCSCTCPKRTDPTTFSGFANTHVTSFTGLRGNKTNNMTYVTGFMTSSTQNVAYNSGFTECRTENTTDVIGFTDSGIETMTDATAFTESSNQKLTDVTAFTESSTQKVTDVTGLTESSTQKGTDVTGLTESSAQTVTDVTAFTESSAQKGTDVTGFTESSTQKLTDVTRFTESSAQKVTDVTGFTESSAQKVTDVTGFTESRTQNKPSSSGSRNRPVTVTAAPMMTSMPPVEEATCVRSPMLEPDVSDTDENYIEDSCVAMLSFGVWVEKDCLDLLPFICYEGKTLWEPLCCRFNFRSQTSSQKYCKLLLKIFLSTVLEQQLF